MGGEDLFAQTCLEKASDVLRPSTSPQMELALPTGPRTSRRTRNGSPIASGHPQQPCIHSRKRTSGSSAGRPQWLPSGSELRFACCQSQQIAILPAQVPFLDYHLTTPL